MSKKKSKLEKKRNDVNSRYWKLKGLSLWSEKIRSVGKCEVCRESEKMLNAHHILPKEKYKEFMFLLENGICLCQNCHKFGKFSAHVNPIWFADWLQKNKPMQHAWAILHMEDVTVELMTFKDSYDRLSSLGSSVPPSS